MESDSHILTRKARKSRKRGAQPGNTNAIKHGFYSQRLRQVEEDAGLEEVIALLHRLLRRAAELTADPGLELPALLRALDRISSAGDRLARLLRAQKELDTAPDEAQSALSQVLDEIAIQKGFK